MGYAGHPGNAEALTKSKLVIITNEQQRRPRLQMPG